MRVHVLFVCHIRVVMGQESNEHQYKCHPNPLSDEERSLVLCLQQISSHSGEEGERGQPGQRGAVPEVLLQLVHLVVQGRGGVCVRSVNGKKTQQRESETL